MATPRVQILVCTNERPADSDRPSCAPRGGLEVYRRFKDAIRSRGLRNEVIVTRTGCLKHCSFGVTVGVWPQNQWYARVTTGDVEEILEASVGEEPAVVERLALPADAPWE